MSSEIQSNKSSNLMIIIMNRCKYFKVINYYILFHLKHFNLQDIQYAANYCI